jgi:hypothetical protein
MKWEINGRKLDRPDIIIRRILMVPFYCAAKCLLFLIILIGLGISDARKKWYDIG